MKTGFSGGAGFGLEHGRILVALVLWRGPVFYVVDLRDTFATPHAAVDPREPVANRGPHGHCRHTAHDDQENRF